MQREFPETPLVGVGAVEFDQLGCRGLEPRRAAQHQAAFEADPGAPSAILALKRLHTAHQRHHDLITVLEREAVVR